MTRSDDRSFSRLRLAQYRLLAAGLLRSPAGWLPLAGGAVAAVTVRLTAAFEPQALPLRVRLLTLALAMAAAPAVDEPTPACAAATPTPLPARRLCRVAVVLGLVACSWVALLVSVPSDARPPLGLATAELAALTTLTLGAATVAARLSPEGTGGMGGALATFVLWLASTVGRASWMPVPGPSDSNPSVARLAAVAAFGSLVAALLSRDPARRRRFSSSS